MILDERSYLIKPEHVKDYLDTYVAEGMALQVGHLGDLIGWFTTDCGTVNEVVHIWRFRDMGDRERRPRLVVELAGDRHDHI
ncbi:MAG: NIPSNAP family protein, partial [Verrucomicrobiota bacterium]